MSDDFNFDDDDLFADFDDDDDFADDDFGGDDFGDDLDDFRGDDVDFDDDDFGADLDLEFLDEDEDLGGLDDDLDVVTTQQPGTSRGFIIIGGIMIAFFLIGLLIIGAIFLSGGTGSQQAQASQTAFVGTSAAIEMTNDRTNTEIAASGTAAVEQVTQTEVAFQQMTADAVATQDAQIAATATQFILNETATQDAILQSTVDAEDEFARQTQAAMDEEEANAAASATALEMTLNPPQPEVTTSGTEVEATQPPVDLPAVQQTATALAILFAATPTPEEVVVVQPTAADTPVGTTDGLGQGGGLPDTGLFDDVFQGNPMFILLTAFGLLGVIVVSRGLRVANRKEED